MAEGRPIYKLSPATHLLPLPKVGRSAPEPWRLEEALQPKVSAWTRADTPAFVAQGAALKEGAALKLTRTAGEPYVRVSGLFILYIPFGDNHDGQTLTNGGVTNTCYKADVLVQAS